MAIQFALPQAHIIWNFLARSEGSGWKCTTKAVSEPALSQPQRLRCRRFLQHSARTTSPASVMPTQPLRSSFSRRVHPLARSYKDASVNRVPLERSRVLRSCQWAPIASIAGSTRYIQRRRLQLCRLKKWGATDCTSLLTLRPHLLVSLIPSSDFSPQFMPYLHCLLLEGATLQQEKKRGGGSWPWKRELMNACGDGLPPARAYPCSNHNSTMIHQGKNLDQQFRWQFMPPLLHLLQNTTCFIHHLRAICCLNHSLQLVFHTWWSRLHLIFLWWPKEWGRTWPMVRQSPCLFLLQSQ